MHQIVLYVIQSHNPQKPNMVLFFLSRSCEGGPPIAQIPTYSVRPLHTWAVNTGRVWHYLNRDLCSKYGKVFLVSVCAFFCFPPESWLHCIFKRSTCTIHLFCVNIQSLLYLLKILHLCSLFKGTNNRLLRCLFCSRIPKVNISNLLDLI